MSSPTVAIELQVLSVPFALSVQPMSLKDGTQLTNIRKEVFLTKKVVNLFYKSIVV